MVAMQKALTPADAERMLMQRFANVAISRRERGRPFEAADVTDDEVTTATLYATVEGPAGFRGVKNAGVEQFMLDVRAQVNERRRGLSDGQVKGVMNVIAQDYAARIAAVQDEWDVRVAAAIPAPVVVAAPAPFALPRDVTAALPDGRYTVSLDGTQDDSVTIRLETMTADQLRGSPAGSQFASYLNGPDNWANYKWFARVTGRGYDLMRAYKAGDRLDRALTALLTMDKAGQLAAGEAYARMSNNCSRCGRDLTRLDSIEHGQGAVCWAKSGRAYYAEVTE